VIVGGRVIGAVGCQRCQLRSGWRKLRWRIARVERSEIIRAALQLLQLFAGASSTGDDFVQSCRTAVAVNRRSAGSGQSTRRCVRHRQKAPGPAEKKVW